MFREFKPKPSQRSAMDQSETALLFERGEFKAAYRSCQEQGWLLASFSTSLVKMARTMYYTRPGELATLVFKYQIDVGYDIHAILRSQLRQNDYHGFLKNVFRFSLTHDFEIEVEGAIANIRRDEEADVWRKKLGTANQALRPLE